MKAQEKRVSKDRYGTPATTAGADMTVMDSTEFKQGFGNSLGNSGRTPVKNVKPVANLDDTDAEINFALESMKKKGSGVNQEVRTSAMDEVAIRKVNE